MTAIPFSFAAGFVIDRFGTRFSIGLFTMLCFVGLTLMAYSSSTATLNFNLLLVGVAIFGMGSDGILIWFSCVTSVWFFYSEVAIAGASCVIFSRLGAMVAVLTTPVRY